MIRPAPTRILVQHFYSRKFSTEQVDSKVNGAQASLRPSASDSAASPQPSPPQAPPASPSGSPGQRNWSKKAWERGRTLWTYRGQIIFVGVVGFLGWNYLILQLKAAKRDKIQPRTMLHWKIVDGSIVEARSPTDLVDLLQNGSDFEDKVKVMTLVQVIKTLYIAARDDRIIGIFADLTDIGSVPSGALPGSLGFAQIEEIREAIQTFKKAKKAKFGELAKFVAHMENCDSHQQYMLASCFDEIYMQRTGSIPLVGLARSTLFYKGLLEKLGIKVHADARKEYKSVVAPYTQDRWTKEQAENADALLDDLNDHMLRAIAIGRLNAFQRLEGKGSKTLLKLTKDDFDAFKAKPPSLVLIDDYGHTLEEDMIELMLEQHERQDVNKRAEIEKLLSGADDLENAGQLKAFYEQAQSRVEAIQKDLVQSRDIQIEEIVAKLKKIVHDGPFSATEALGKGLIDGIAFKRNLLNKLRELEPDIKFMNFGHYHRVQNRLIEKHLDPDQVINIGLVYLLGTIDGSSSTYGTWDVVKGLRQAAADDEIGAVVLRIDSGGGAVTSSETLLDAVRHVQESGKRVIASFGNVSASGAYYCSAFADEILAAQSTITGSIGVASLRPTVTERLLGYLGLTIDARFTGSDALSILREPSEHNRARASAQVDAIYKDFTDLVCEGRSIDPADIDQVAGGRVMTGQRGFELGQREKPIGRGLVDRLGGIWDAGMIATQLWLKDQLEEYQKPEEEGGMGLSLAEARAQILPNCARIIDPETGEHKVQSDLRFVTFPKEKSFSERLAEAAERGDGFNEVWEGIQTRFALYLLKTARWLVGQEITKATRLRSSVDAEMDPISFR